MKLTYTQLNKLSDAISQRKGWDFSSIQTTRAPTPWNYLALARRYIIKTDYVLDIGTGGGEKFLSLASSFRKGMGIDISRDMIEQANQNKANQQVENIDFKIMDVHNLAFPDNQFDVVLNRHCIVDSAETKRVLGSNGYFITQQVAKQNTANILDAFGWSHESFGDEWWQPIDGIAEEFKKIGCRIVAIGEYNVRYWFCNVESLLFWLKAVPLPEPFDIDKHWKGVNCILTKYTTEKGIETNEHRELLIVEKV